jgi:heme/copper-type cytochrome/quinol oxidase subunit 2
MASSTPSTISLLLFWTSALACAIAQLAILRAALRRPAEDAPPVARAPRPHSPIGEVIWALVPAVALGFVLFWTWAAIHEPAAGAPVGSNASAHSVSAHSASALGVHI